MSSGDSSDSSESDSSESMQPDPNILINEKMKASLKAFEVPREESKNQSKKVTGALVKMPTIMEYEPKKKDSAKNFFDFDETKYKPSSSNQKK